MINIYYTDKETKEYSKIEEYKVGSWIDMRNPSESEIQKVCEQLKIKEDFIHYALDVEEKARIDVEDEDDTVLFIIDVPIVEKETGMVVYSTMPIGIIFVRDDFFITVSIKKNQILQDCVKGNMKNFGTYKKSRFLLQILYKNASYYLTYLKLINKETQVAENVLKTSLRNEELLKMLALEKSLVYFTTSLKSNEVVMEKTSKGKVVKLYEDDEDILEDAIIENKQAIEMSKIYSDILGGTLETYASIISNNLNTVVKLLTSITIILTIPTLISSFWGMNVPVPFQGSQYGFLVMIIISLVVTLATIILLKKKDLL